MRFVNKNIYFLIIFFIVSLILTFLLLGAENFSIKGYLYSENRFLNTKNKNKRKRKFKVV